MKDSVIIKSNKHGLTLLLDKEISFEQLVRDICYKFANSKDFFGEASMVLSIEGRAISAEEAAVIIEAIELNSNISVLLIEEKQEIKDTQMLGKIDKFYYEKLYENAKIIRGNVANNETITSESSIIVLGDVKARASLQAKGNVIVLGTIEGNVHAGYPSDNNCYIVAGKIEADEVSVGSITDVVQIQSKWYQRTNKSLKDAVSVVVWENSLLSEPLHSGLLKHI